MKIILPIEGSYERYPKGNLIQGYKENVALYQQSLNMQGHNGWDLVKFYGAPIPAPHDGTVVLVDYQGQGYGNRVDILSDEENGKFLVSTLGHLTEEKLVQLGQRVKAGDVVGKMGNSGFVVSGGVPYWGQSNPDKKGTHTHWTPKWLHRVKPGEQGASVSYQNVPYIIENYNNGVFGAIDPLTLLEGESMDYYKIKGEATVVKKEGGKYWEIATDGLFYPYIKELLQLPDALNEIGRDVVNANLAGQLVVGITYVKK